MTEFHVTRFLSDGTRHTHRTYRRGYSAGLRFQQLAYEMLGDSADRDTNEGHRVMDAAERTAEAVTRGGVKSGTVHSRGRRIVIEAVEPAPAPAFVEPAASVVGSSADAPAYLAIQCQREGQPRGTFLYQGDNWRTGRLVSPVFTDSVELYQWAPANGWSEAPYDSAHPVGVYVRRPAAAPAMAPQPCQQQQGQACELPTFQVRVRRVVREDTIVTVRAASEDEARRLAEMDATSIDQDQWDTYDCDYDSEIEAAV